MMMNLIDRYVREVGRRLPRKQRADVQEELRSNLLDTLEDRVDGKPAEEDVIALLKDMGSPEEMAASYRPSGQYLVGPELYPLFRLVTGAVLLAVTIGLAVTFIIGLIFGPIEPADLGQRLISAFGGYIQALLSAIGSVVIVFAILQRLGVKPDEEDTGWDPHDLPDIEDHNVAGRGEAIAGIAFSIVFLVLLNMFTDRFGLIVQLGQPPLLNQIIRDNLVWLNAALLLGLGLNIVLLLQGRWHFYTRVLKIAIDLFWVYVLYQIALTLSAEKEMLVEAGLVEPVPTLLTRLAFGIVILVAVLIIVDAIKVIYRAVRSESASSDSSIAQP
jgi:hypothetical protein